LTTAGVILAAGGGTRFIGPTHKLLAPFGYRRVIDHSVARAIEAAIGPVYVVTGAVSVTLVQEPRAPSQAVIVQNDAWADGIATSLAAGIAAAARDGHDAIVVGLGDQPSVSVEAWRRVAAAIATPMAVATYDGVRGNPVRLAAAVWPDLPTTGDEGARVLLRSRGSEVTEVPCPGSAADVDTVEDLHRWS
jgi:CTP:molybdopterin cytidylyltransferase MocA